MKKPLVIFVMTLLFWLVIGGTVIRLNRLWFGPVTFRWSNLAQPNASFRWATTPSSAPVVIPADTRRSFKVTVPRKFSHGELVITTGPGQGSLTINIDAPAGRTNPTNSIPAGGTAILSLSWEAIAVQTRTFNVDLAAADRPVTISTVRMKLQP